MTCTPIVGPLVGHGGQISIIRFSDDGRNFCSLDMNNHVLVWDALTYEIVGVLPHQSDMRIFEIGIVGDRVISFLEDFEREHCTKGDIWEFPRGSLVTSYAPENGELVDFQGGHFSLDRIFSGSRTEIGSCHDLGRSHKQIHPWTDDLSDMHLIRPFKTGLQVF
jgi:hypothetical protein